MKTVILKNVIDFDKLTKNSINLSEKVFLKNKQIIKLFFTRGTISSGFINPYSERLIKNSLKLKKLGVHSIKVTHHLIFEFNKRMSGVIYNKLDGKTIREICKERDLTVAEIKYLAKFTSTLHNEGIYFKAMHLGNLVLNKKIYLIDIAKINFYPWPLWFNTRIRAFKRIFKYKDDLKNFGDKNLNIFLTYYCQFSKIGPIKQHIFLFLIKKLADKKLVKTINKFKIFFLVLAGFFILDFDWSIN